MRKSRNLKKLLSLLVTIILSIILIACDGSLTAVNSVDEVKDIMDQWIPSVITHDTVFPEIVGTTVEYTINGKIVEDLKTFERPLYDQDVILEVTVYGNDTTRTLSYDTMLLSDYSPRHGYQLYLDSFDMSALSRENLQPNAVVLRQDNEILLESSIQLRGRGNSSFFTFEKKSLKIEFESNIEWMGLRGDSFNLLAMHSDKSFMRDALAHMASKMLGLEITQAFRYVELYNGTSYIGLYLLVEDRTYIKVDDNEDTLDFAVEVDERIRWEGFLVPHIMVENRPHSIKRPFNPTNIQSSDIQSYLQNTIDMIQLGQTPAYVDVTNWMQFLFIHELFKNVDAWALSIFLYQDQTEILKMGPVWDFDLSVANADYVSETYYNEEGFYLLNHPNATWFKDTMQLTSFNREFKTVVQTFYIEHLSTFKTIMDTLADSLIPYAQKNFYTYDILNTYIWPNPTFLYNITYNEQTAFVKNFLFNRAAWMNEEVLTSNFMNKRYYS